MSVPIVSVCIITYNHYSFIQQCLDSVLNQVTNFNYEIIIGEDESNDGTRELCIAYAEKYADKISLILNNRIDVSIVDGVATGNANMMKVINAAKGEFIALLEGDDYWLDEKKLQKQVDFMRLHADVSVCGTRFFYLAEDTGIKKESALHVQYPFIFKTDSLLSAKGEVVTLTVLIRKNCLPLILPEWIKTSPMGDICFFYLASLHEKKIAIISDVTAARRIHGTSYFSSKSPMKRFEMYRKTLSIINKESGNKWHKEIKLAMIRTLIKIQTQLIQFNYPTAVSIINANQIKLIQYALLYPQFYRDIIWLYKILFKKKFGVK